MSAFLLYEEHIDYHPENIRAIWVPLHVIKQIHPFHILRSSRYQRISKQMQTWSTMQSLAPCCEQDTKTPVATHIPISFVPLYFTKSPVHKTPPRIYLRSDMLGFIPYPSPI